MKKERQYESLYFNGQPTEKWNTQALLKPFITELENNNYICEIIWLYEKNIAACTACRTCQQTWDCFGCRFHDDAYDLFDRALVCDMIVLATPIYSWYYTPSMKVCLPVLYMVWTSIMVKKKVHRFGKGKSHFYRDLWLSSRKGGRPLGTGTHKILQAFAVKLFRNAYRTW